MAASSERRSMPWFRFYTEAFADTRLRGLDPAYRWLWVSVLGMARSSPVAGLLLVGNSRATSEVTPKELADYSALPTRTVANGLAKLEAAGMIERNDDPPCWSVVAWDRRQFASDTSTDRVRAHRERQQSSTAVPETFQERSPDRFRNAPETETETETETVSSPARNQKEAVDKSNNDLIEIAKARATRLGRTNPTTAWLNSVARSLDAPRAHTLLTNGLTPALADLELDRTQPTEPPPTLRGDLATIARNAERTNGTACPTCDGSRWILDDNETAMQCPDCSLDTPLFGPLRSVQ
jgi:hypothetical protein